MRRIFFCKGAPGSGAPFSFPVLCACLLCALSQSTAAAGCPSGHIDERVQVIYVYDGDTVKLKDGRRVRLIGINTPEMARDGGNNEPLASEARTTLQDMLDRGNRMLHLQYGAQHNDHYGRLLAHAFLDNGDNVAARLLQKGLATALVVPPNTWAIDCYQRLEDDARIDRIGLWALAGYQALASTGLPPDTTGFRIVRGRVTEIRESSRSTWIDLEGPLVLHVSRKDRTSFAPGYLEQLAGQDVEARGWVRHDSNGLRMNIRHPAALVKITPGSVH
jgi:micrococcal nuclease